MLDATSATILTIDDEHVLRRSIVAYLEDSGFEVIEAENGREGIKTFRSEKPDLILTDLQMPEMGGLELLGIISKEAPDTPVIVVSGAGGMSDVIEALRLGAWDYLTKPVTDLAVLEHAVCKALERSRLIEENKIYREKLKKNLETLEEDQRAGRSVQMRLLPERNLSHKPYIFDHTVTPSLYLSGDFVEYFKISEEKLGFYIADVSGHGAASAFLTVLLKSLVAQILSRYQTHRDDMVISPDKIMARLSSEIHSAKLGKYLTMIYGIIDLNTNECTYAVGGHYPNPLLLTAEKCEYLPGGGYPVGIVPKVDYNVEKIQFPKDAKLVMFSDGVMEVVPEEDMEKKEQWLLDKVVETQADPEKILDILGVDPDQELPDDITMLIVSFDRLESNTESKKEAS